MPQPVTLKSDTRKVKSDTRALIEKTSQRVARLELVLAKHKAKIRRLETREKILWGSLVAKAHLDGFSLPALYGAFLDIESQLSSEPDLLDVFRAKGEAVFLGYQSIPKPSITPINRRLNATATVEAIGSGLNPESVSGVEPTISLNSESTTSSVHSLSLLKKMTRRKIQQGGLMIKARLHLLSKAQLLGALVTLAESLSHERNLEAVYWEVGEAALERESSGQVEGNRSGSVVGIGRR